MKNLTSPLTPIGPHASHKLEMTDFFEGGSKDALKTLGTFPLICFLLVISSGQFAAFHLLTNQIPAVFVAFADRVIATLHTLLSISHSKDLQITDYSVMTG